MIQCRQLSFLPLTTWGWEKTYCYYSKKTLLQCYLWLSRIPDVVPEYQWRTSTWIHHQHIEQWTTQRTIYHQCFTMAIDQQYPRQVKGYWSQDISSHHLTHNSACWITFNSFVGTFRSHFIATHLEDVFMWSQRYMRIMHNKGIEIGCWPDDRTLQVSFTNTSDCANDDLAEFLITLVDVNVSHACIYLSTIYPINVIYHYCIILYILSTQ